MNEGAYGKSLSLEEKSCNYDTMKHMELVRNLLNKIVAEILKRGELHDQSKLTTPEVEYFTEYTPKLAAMTYGSEEYQKCAEGMRPALKHHYANNRHHPEHFGDGIRDMNIVDIVEMLCDWKAASSRHNDGNIRKSIRINANRFGISPDLVCILENSVELLG